MNTIKIKVDYDGAVKLNGEHTLSAPFETMWFPDNDLTIETAHEKLTVNSKTDITVTPKKADRKLEILPDVKLQLAKNNMAHYVIINDRFACKLPAGIDFNSNL